MPKVLKNLWDRWKLVAHAIGRFQTRLILTLLYFVIIAPLGALF